MFVENNDPIMYDIPDDTQRRDEGIANYPLSDSLTELLPEVQTFSL